MEDFDESISPIDAILVKEPENVYLSTKLNEQNNNRRVQHEVPAVVYGNNPPTQAVCCCFFTLFVFCLSLMIPTWIFAFKAFEELTSNNGTNCDSADIENTLKLYLINHGIFIGIAFLSICVTIFDSERVQQEEETFATGCISLVAVINIYFRMAWYIMFLVAYNQEIPDCLDGNDDPNFDEAYIYIKIVFIVEAVVTGSFMAIMALLIVCSPLFFCVCFCICIRDQNRMYARFAEDAARYEIHKGLQQARIVGHTASLFNWAALNAIEEDLLPPPLPPEEDFEET